MTCVSVWVLPALVWSLYKNAWRRNLRMCALMCMLDLKVTFQDKEKEEGEQEEKEWKGVGKEAAKM